MAAIFQAGNTAVITGGASGIGLALAKKCSASGMKVLVVDWNEELLSAAGREIGGDVSTVKADVSKAEEWAAVTKAVDSELGGKVSLLSLNAGIGRRSGWDDASVYRETMDVNFFGVVNGIVALLPAVKKTASASSSSSSGTKAAVVITGSKQGITNPPGSPAYNASKAAVRSLAEQLDFDLRSEPGVSAHLLVPGWTFTAMTGAGAQREKPAGAWLPEQVVRYLEQKMDEGRFYIVCPDNDVDEQTDRRRMLWAAGDVAEGRPALTRWREDWKERAAEWIDKQDV